MNRKLAVALSGCAVLALTLTACGDDRAEQTEAWAKNVCDGVQPQVQKIQTANMAIAEASEGDKSAAEVQEADSAAFRDIADAYAELASAVDSAGDPPVEDGEQLRQDAVGELNAIAESYGALQESIDELDTSDQAEFAEGLKGIAAELERLGETGDEALSRLQSGDLGEAMARQEGCRSTPVPSPGEEDVDEQVEEQQDGEDGDGESEDDGEDGRDEDDE
ncbi:hypothetical protein GCM10009716_36650 [Streptomyces sodiiphilus]|uniref:Small secreted protein n=1 Tax=Streptomyces sodiiphilus TaxID=226217 RepID=A0ABP5AXM8_9ACTN